MVPKTTIIHNAWCISLTHDSSFFLSLVLLEAHEKKSLHKVKAQFSCVCGGLGHDAPTMADTPECCDFPKDMKAIISHGTSFQLFPSSIYKKGSDSQQESPLCVTQKTIAFRLQ